MQIFGAEAANGGVTLKNDKYGMHSRKFVGCSHARAV